MWLHSERVEVTHEKVPKPGFLVKWAWTCFFGSFSSDQHFPSAFFLGVLSISFSRAFSMSISTGETCLQAFTCLQLSTSFLFLVGCPLSCWRDHAFLFAGRQGSQHFLRCVFPSSFVFQSPATDEVSERFGKKKRQHVLQKSFACGCVSSSSSNDSSCRSASGITGLLADEALLESRV